MKRNDDLQRDVQDAIKWESILSSTEIGVIAKDGIITLTGTVHSSYQKNKAGRIAKNVPGVFSIENEIVIEYN